MALRSKFDDGQVTILEDLSLPGIGTKQVSTMLSALGLGGTSVLLVTPEYDSVAYKSSRNIPTVWVSPAGELNAYNVLHQRQLVLTQSALSALLEASQPVAAG
jgi:ribosomal protein L4